MTPAILLACLISVSAPPIDPPDTLVICPQGFRATLNRWIEYRERQGHKILVEAPADSSYGIRSQIKRVAKSGQLKNIVIVGDANGSDTRRVVPTDFVRAKVNVHFGSEPDIASDNSYADINRDGIVDLAIGRIPVDTNKQLERIIDRIIKYEAAADAGPWERKVNFIAGVGGFGSMVDKMIEESAKQMITDLIPPAYDTTMTYGSWQSPYCPDPRKFSETTINRFNEGVVSTIQRS